MGTTICGIIGAAIEHENVSVILFGTNAIFKQSKAKEENFNNKKDWGKLYHHRQRHRSLFSLV